MTTLAQITENGWITLASSAVILVTLIINRIADRADKSTEREQARLDRESDARIALATRLETGRVRDTIVKKIDANLAAIEDNTLVTQQHGATAKEMLASSAADVREVLSHLVKVGDFRTMLPTATKASSAEPVYHLIALPGSEYEVFPLTESGGQCEWRSEPCPKGRKVRFRCAGPCRMGLHFHRLTAEFLFMVDGELLLETAEHVVHLKKGDSYQTPADMVHSASVRESGEVLCTWTELESDELEIGIWPGPATAGTTTTTTTVTTTP